MVEVVVELWLAVEGRVEILSLVVPVVLVMVKEEAKVKVKTGNG
jgi:hypothetical protein